MDRVAAVDVDVDTACCALEQTQSAYYLQLRQSKAHQAVLKKADIESNPLPKQVHVSLAQIEDKAT
jgi:hypothetical protein